MYYIDVVEDKLNFKIVVSSALLQVLDSIKINTQPINYEAMTIDEQNVELVLDLNITMPLNTFIPLYFLDKFDRMIQVKAHKNFVKPFTKSDHHVLFLIHDDNIMIKTISINELIFNNKQKQLALDVLSLEIENNLYKFEISGFKSNQLQNITIIAEQKDTKLCYIAPIYFEKNTIIISEYYFSGVFDLHYIYLLNNTYFNISLNLPEGDLVNQFNEVFGKANKRILLLDNLDFIQYDIKNDSSIEITFLKKGENVDRVIIITECEVIPAFKNEQNTKFFLKNAEKVMSRKNKKLVIYSGNLIVITDFPKNFAVEFYNGKFIGRNEWEKVDFLKTSVRLDINEITVDDTKVKFQFYSDNEQPFLNDEIYILMHKRKSKEMFILDGKLKENTISFDLSDFIGENQNTQSERWDFYLFKRNKYSSRNVIYRLGCFQDRIDDKPLRFYPIIKYAYESKSTYNHHYSVYLTNKNELSLVKNNISNLIKEQYEIKTSIQEFSMKRNHVNVVVKISSKYSNLISSGNVFLINRNKDYLDKRIFPNYKTSVNENELFIHCKIDLSKGNFYPMYWDLYIGLFVDNKEYYIRASNVSTKVKHDVDTTISKYQLNIGQNIIVYPYITLSNDLSFTVREKEYFENRYYLVKENIAFYVARLFNKHFSKKDIWIGYEKLAMSAHESGYYFFDYIYKNKKHDNFYYVINKDSPEFVNLKDKKDKVLYFMSFKYFVYMFAAKLLISSDTKRNSYNLKLKKSKLANELTTKKLVYLQHGVNGLKKVPDFYKDRGVFDLVIAPSEFERKMIINYWGYDESEVVTTGLARWDVLEEKTDQVDFKQIFVMPTWRTWMDGMTKEQFVQTDYFRNYNGFLSSKRLGDMLKENNIRIKFFLHPKFKAYIDLFKFDSSHIEKFEFLEVPLDEMIMKSSLMISDYSSVIWEMFYLEKPCVFYHFDREKYLKYEGAYLNFDKDLFGDIAFDKEGLIDIIEQYIERGFKEKQEFGKLRDKYFTYMDKSNSERIYEAIKENKDRLYKDNETKKRKLSHIIPFKLRRKILSLYRKGLK